MIAYVCVFNKAVNGFEQIRQYQFNATAFRTRKVLLARGLERGILKASGSQLSATKTLSTVMILLSAIIYTMYTGPGITLSSPLSNNTQRK